MCFYSTKISWPTLSEHQGFMVNIHGPLLNVFHSVLFRMSNFSSFRTNRDRSYTHLKSAIRGLDKKDHMCNFVSRHIHRFVEVTQTCLSTSEEAKLILLSLRSFFISKKKIGRRRRARRGCRGRRWAPLPVGLSQRKIFRFYFPKHESWLRNINIFDQNQNAFPTRIKWALVRIPKTRKEGPTRVHIPERGSVVIESSAHNYVSFVEFRRSWFLSM